MTPNMRIYTRYARTGRATICVWWLYERLEDLRPLLVPTGE